MSASKERALVIGLGLIGGSVAAALRQQSWEVWGRDVDIDRALFALEHGLVDHIDAIDSFDLLVLAVPIDVMIALAPEVLQFLESNHRLIATDVSGVKSLIGDTLRHPRFIGGHPMAGAELVGPQGSRADLFVGSTWVLCPEEETQPAAFARLHGIVSDFGASPMALTAAEHDRLVAMVSHLPHLVAVTLMNQAHEAAAADPALLRLAAGGFRDMTRVASGDPRIWPDLVLENQTAILEGIKGLQDGLEELSKALRTGNRAVIAQRLSDAQIARRSLPVAHQAGGLLNAIRVPVSNRTGVLSDITTAASSRNVSILDIEIAHSAESAGGVLVLVIERKDLEALGDELSARGYRFSSVEIEP